MRLLLDANLSYRICPYLHAAGHDAVHVDEIGLGCANDTDIMSRAVSDGSVVVTCDHDFVQLLFASGGTEPSVLLTREVNALPAREVAELILAALSPELEEYLKAGAIATLTQDRVRVRPLPLPGRGSSAS